MKLSTAIRIGSMTTKQVTGVLSDGGNGRCAIGAALDAAGFTDLQASLSWGCDLVERFPIAQAIIAFSHRADIRPEDMYLYRAIWLMNDAQGKTREEIADYVEQVENEHDGYLQTGVTESQPLEQIAMEVK